jgi:Cof subfamily protein (haloacid dehalogenase superfamily)
MTYRLVVADLDGTARSRRLGITPGVRAAVAAARARGLRVCVATGRMWRSAAPWVAELGADPPVILYNGGQVLDFATGQVLLDRRLAPEVARAVLALLGRVPEVQPHLYVGDGVYVERPHPFTDAFAADDGIGYEVVPALAGLVDAGGAGPRKLLVIGSASRIEALQAEVRGTGLPVHAVRSEPTYLEVLPPGVSKGTALAAVLAHLGLAPHEVVAVGDNWNDLEMIEAAGLGVAMGHAPAGVRARADLVVGTAEEEGLREVLERHLG